MTEVPFIRAMVLGLHGTMADEKKTLKFQMMMSPQEAEQLDDWMFRNRLRSRAEAIRRLCQVGLALDGHTERLNDLVMRRGKEVADLHKKANADIKAAATVEEQFQAVQQVLNAGRQSANLAGDLMKEVFWVLALANAHIHSEEMAEARDAIDEINAIIASSERSSSSILSDEVAQKTAAQTISREPSNDDGRDRPPPKAAPASRKERK